MTKITRVTVYTHTKPWRVIYKIPIPKGWRVVGPDVYKPELVKKGDKYLNLIVLEETEEIKWCPVEQKFLDIGANSVAFALLIRKITKKRKK